MAWKPYSCRKENLVEPPSNPNSTWLQLQRQSVIDKLGNERKGVVVAYGVLVDWVIVLDGVKQSIPLLYEEEGGSIVAL